MCLLIYLLIGFVLGFVAFGGLKMKKTNCRIGGLENIEFMQYIFMVGFIIYGILIIILLQA
jgi:hypothetical protein